MTEEIKLIRENRDKEYLLNVGDKCMVDESVLDDEEKIIYLEDINKIYTVEGHSFAHGYLVGYCLGYTVSINDKLIFMNAEILKLAT